MEMNHVSRQIQSDNKYNNAPIRRAASRRGIVLPHPRTISSCIMKEKSNSTQSPPNQSDTPVVRVYACPGQGTNSKRTTHKSCVDGREYARATRPHMVALRDSALCNPPPPGSREPSHSKGPKIQFRSPNVRFEVRDATQGLSGLRRRSHSCEPRALGFVQIHSAETYHSFSPAGTNPSSLREIVPCRPIPRRSLTPCSAKDNRSRRFLSPPPSSPSVWRKSVIRESDQYTCNTSCIIHTSHATYGARPKVHPFMMAPSKMLVINPKKQNAVVPTLCSRAPQNENNGTRMAPLAPPTEPTPCHRELLVASPSIGLLSPGPLTDPSSISPASSTTDSSDAITNASEFVNSMQRIHFCDKSLVDVQHKKHTDEVQPTITSSDCSKTLKNAPKEGDTSRQRSIAISLSAFYFTLLDSAPQPISEKVECIGKTSVQNLQLQTLCLQQHIHLDREAILPRTNPERACVQHSTIDDDVKLFTKGTIPLRPCQVKPTQSVKGKTLHGTKQRMLEEFFNEVVICSTPPEKDLQ